MAVTGGDSEGGLAGAGGPGAGQDVGVAPESEESSCGFLGLDGKGWLQIVGGLVIGLIALYSSYDHFNVFGRVIPLNQQFGIWFIVASLAVVVVVAEGFCAAVAQLASRSRLRAANETAEARERQAEAAERQGQGIALLRGAALLSARVQLEPSELNRPRLSAFLALLAEQTFLDQQGPES